MNTTSSPSVILPTGKGYVVLLSGGLDSSVLAFCFARAGLPIKALTIDYGQRHSKEQNAAKDIAAALNIDHKILSLGELRPILGEGSSLLNQGMTIPEGHYADESMKSTVVPNRNMILLSIATAWSIASGLEGVAYAAHAGDHAIYPDCRPAFADAMNDAIKLCDYTRQELVRPFVSLTKADIVKVGVSLGVPFERTWSCYNGRAAHCGKCGTCFERIEAFELAGAPDPTRYAPR
ncbi:MAG TPA: 7-cyano-7-deazaguanine synthase QueC [Bryobacteraceae bacterium]